MAETEARAVQSDPEEFAALQKVILAFHKARMKRQQESGETPEGCRRNSVEKRQPSSGENGQWQRKTKTKKKKPETHGGQLKNKKPKTSASGDQPDDGDTPLYLRVFRSVIGSSSTHSAQ